MASHEISLLSHEEIAHGTMAFHFEKPRDFSFKAGQAVDVTLIGNAEKVGPPHAFSLVSAPFEERLTIATRLRDSRFKQALRAMTPGSPVRIEGPLGSLILHNNRARPAVFVAGGIGVTPFVSILRQAAHARLEQRLILLYSNRRPEDAAYLSELRALERTNGNCSLLATMTQAAKSSMPWTGQTGSIDRALIERVSSELVAPIYYVAGPPTMVEDLRQTLNSAGIDDDIRSEEFYGY